MKTYIEEESFMKTLLIKVYKDWEECAENEAEGYKQKCLLRQHMTGKS